MDKDQVLQTLSPTAWVVGRAGFVKAHFARTLEAVGRKQGCDLVLCSPPYADARTYGAGVSWGDQDYARLGDAVFGALNLGGTAIIVVDAPVRNWRKGMGTERGFFPWKLMIDWAERVGFRVPDRLAYARNALPGEYRGRFRNDWEPLLWFQKPGGDPYFDKWALVEKAKYGNPGTSTGFNPDGSKCQRKPTGRAWREGKKHRGTLWNYGAVGHGHDDPEASATKHPARFNTRLAMDVVACFCPLGGLVCDPMVGSGTSAVAAVRCGRRFFGGDSLCRSDDGIPWAKVAADRVRKDQGCGSA